MAIFRIQENKLAPIPQTTFAASGIKERADLQRMLRDQIEVIAPDTLVIAEEFGSWRSYTFEELQNRDKLSLDLFWIKDDSVVDSDSLPDPDILAQEIVDDLENALEQFASIAGKLIG